MRYTVAGLLLSILCSAPVLADSIELDVNAWATITAPTTCKLNCSETIDVSFAFINNPDGAGTVVPGTMSFSSSGFLAPLTPVPGNAFYLGMFNNVVNLNSGGQEVLLPTDEIDLYYDVTANAPNVIVPGTNTLGFAFYACRTQACTNAYGATWAGYQGPTGGAIQEGSTVRQVPDGDSPLALSLAAFGAFALAWRWRRQEVLLP